VEKLTDLGGITIGNDGADIKTTNYWDTDHAKKGIIHFSVNGGCIRALVPECMAEVVVEMATGREVILSRGPFPSQGQDDAFEVMFEDNTDNPFALHVSIGQWDMVPKQSDKWIFAAWTAEGKVFQCDKCLVRQVPSLPWLKPW